MVTVRDLARDLELELVAGADAADAPVRWVHISQLADPTPGLSGGELLLTTGLGPGDAHGLRAYAQRLDAPGRGRPGVGLGCRHHTVPAALRDAGVGRGVPPFLVPDELPFIAAAERAFPQLVNELPGVLRRSIAAHERLLRMVLLARGLEGLTGALSTLMGGAVLVYD